MQLLVGLGNPGSEHENDRHNMGFMAVERIAHRHNFGKWVSKFKGLVCESIIGDEKIICLKPQTFMNRSGESVGEALRFYKLEPQQVTVFYDELDLPPGKLRVKIAGGAGGHNGIKDIDRHIGKNYRRVRIGIGHPGDKDLVTGYVLSKFSKTEAALRDELLDAVAEHSELLISGSDNEFMNRIALAMQQQAGA